MASRGSFQSLSKGGEWKGVFMMLLLTFLSVLNVNIAGHSIGFIFLPLIGVCLWPRTDSAVMSIIAILIFGLLLDLLSAGPLGLWALIFLAVFAIFRPHQRLKPHNFRSASTVWLIVLTVAIGGSYFLGWFARQHQPDLSAVLYQALLAMVSFPVIYGFRRIGRRAFSDPDLRGL